MDDLWWWRLWIENKGHGCIWKEMFRVYQGELLGYNEAWGEYWRSSFQYVKIDYWHPYSTRMHNCIISSCITAVCLTLKKSSTPCVARNVSVSILSIFFFGFFLALAVNKESRWNPTLDNRQSTSLLRTGSCHRHVSWQEREKICWFEEPVWIHGKDQDLREMSKRMIKSTSTRCVDSTFSLCHWFLVLP